MKIRTKMRGLRTVIRLSMFGGLIAMSLYNSASGTPALPQARTVSTTTRIPIAKEVFDTRTNEPVHFVDAEAVFRVSFDPNGGTSIDVTGHLRGTAKGNASGRGYEFMVGGQAKFNASRPPLSEFVLAYSGNLTVPGTSSSQPIVITLTATVDANGRVSATVRELRAQPQ